MTFAARMTCVTTVLDPTNNIEQELASATNDATCPRH